LSGYIRLKSSGTAAGSVDAKQLSRMRAL
jgi:hypothetical protein